MKFFKQSHQIPFNNFPINLIKFCSTTHRQQKKRKETATSMKTSWGLDLLQKVKVSNESQHSVSFGSDICFCLGSASHDRSRDQGIVRPRPSSSAWFFFFFFGVVLLPHDVGRIFFPVTPTPPPDSPSSSFQQAVSSGLIAPPRRHPPPDPTVPRPELLYVWPDRRPRQPRTLIRGAATTAGTNLPAGNAVAPLPLALPPRSATISSVVTVSFSTSDHHPPRIQDSDMHL
jgi:hypothetical protein